MGYSKNALKEIIKLSKLWGFEGRYIELYDEVLNLGHFHIEESLDVEDDPLDVKFPCERCGKFYDPNDLNAQEPYLNYCNPCIEIEGKQKEEQGYFNSLRRKGILEDYGLWIRRLYPQFHKYTL